MRRNPVVRSRWLLLLFALALIGASCGDDTTTETAATAECPTAAESSNPLLSGQNLVLTATFEEAAFVEDVTPDGGGVLLEGEGGISFSFCTSGGPVSGMITVTLAGEDNDAITHSVSYTGTLNGDYDPVGGLFDGTVSWSGDVASGFEGVFPSDTVWDGFVLLEPFGCEEIGDCISGGTEPDLDAFWNIELPPEAVNPANG